MWHTQQLTATTPRGGGGGGVASPAWGAACSPLASGATTGPHPGPAQCAVNAPRQTEHRGAWGRGGIACTTAMGQTRTTQAWGAARGRGQAGAGRRRAAGLYAEACELGATEAAWGGVTCRAHMTPGMVPGMIARGAGEARNPAVGPTKHQAPNQTAASSISREVRLFVPRWLYHAGTAVLCCIYAVLR